MRKENVINFITVHSSFIVSTIIIVPLICIVVAFIYAIYSFDLNKKDSDTCSSLRLPPTFEENHSNAFPRTPQPIRHEEEQFKPSAPPLHEEEQFDPSACDEEEQFKPSAPPWDEEEQFDPSACDEEEQFKPSAPPWDEEEQFNPSAPPTESSSEINSELLSCEAQMAYTEGKKKENYNKKQM